jgi:hypothetical protein
MHIEDSSWQRRRKPISRRIAHDIRTVLPVLGLAFCLGSTATAISFGQAVGMDLLASPSAPDAMTADSASEAVRPARIEPASHVVVVRELALRLVAATPRSR